MSIRKVNGEVVCDPSFLEDVLLDAIEFCTLMLEVEGERDSEYYEEQLEKYQTALINLEV